MSRKYYHRLRIGDFFRLTSAIAWRNIRRQKKRSLTVMLTALIGMSAIVMVLGWSNGMFESMISGTIDSGLSHIQIKPKGYSKDQKIGMVFEPETAAYLNGKSIDFRKQHSLIIGQNGKEVKSALSLRLEREGLLRLGSFNRGVMIMGIDPETEREVSGFYSWMKEGKFLEMPDGLPGMPVLISTENAARMEVGIGDGVIISTGSLNGENRSVRAVITGLYQSPIGTVNKHTVIMKRSDLSLLYGDSEDFFGSVVIKGEKPEDADFMKKSIAGFFNHSEDYEILTIWEMAPELKSMIDMSRQFQVIWYVVLMMGFGLTLLNAVLMSVFERMREIGIQKAIGATTGAVVGAIITEALYLALAGCTAGFAAGGLVVSWFSVYGINMSALAGGVEKIGIIASVIYPFITVRDVLLAYSVGLSVSVLAAIYPAWKASGINPVQAIYNK